MHENIEHYFASLEQSNPNCVLLGDAIHNFTYSSLNDAFRLLNGSPDASLFSLGCGKFYRKGGSGELCLDVGPFTKALEFATGKTAEIIGKPSSMYFQSALKVPFLS